MFMSNIYFQRRKSFKCDSHYANLDIDPGHLVDHSILFRVELLLLSSFSRYLDVLNAFYVFLMYFDREPRVLLKLFHQHFQK